MAESYNHNTYFNRYPKSGSWKDKVLFVLKEKAGPMTTAEIIEALKELDPEIKQMKKEKIWNRVGVPLGQKQYAKTIYHSGKHWSLHPITP